VYVAIVPPDDRLAINSQNDVWKCVRSWKRLVDAAHIFEFTEAHPGHSTGGIKCTNDLHRG